MTLSDLQRLTVKEAYAAYFKEPTQAQKAYAKEVMQDCEAPATAVFVAARHLLGPNFISYEPETLWMELDPCLANRDKLMAAIALAMTPSLYWDYRVLGATAHAFTNEVVTPEVIPHCTAAQLAWTAFEAELLFALSDGESTRPEFDDCVQAYIAVCLFEEGFAVPPVGLGFTADELEQKISADSQNLRKETALAWAALPKEKLEHHKFDDSPLGAQLSKLATTWLFVEAKTKQLRVALERL